MGPPTGATPSAEHEVDAGVVRRLLLAQHPDLADLPIVQFASGWDNVMFRLGDELVARLPRRTVAAQLVANEQRWLPQLAPHLPLAVPTPIRIGAPEVIDDRTNRQPHSPARSGSRTDNAYPWPWSIVRWVDGSPAGAPSTPLDAPVVAEQLAGFLSALHRPAPPDAPDNPVRGVPLASRAKVTDERLDRLDAPPDAVDRLRQRWARCLAAPELNGPPLWLHGDLHAYNLIAHHGALSAVIDFGDITSGDPATDLAVAWSLFPPGERHLLRAAAERAGHPVDDAMWRRAEGWALSIGLALAVNSSDNAPMAAIAARMLRE